MLDGRAHMVSFRNDNTERAGIDWKSGRAGTQTVLDVQRAREALQSQEARIAALDKADCQSGETE